MTPKYFAFDTETTGLDPVAGAHILSLGYIILDAQMGEIARGQQFFYPKSEEAVEPGAARVNGYTRASWEAKGALDNSAIAPWVQAVWDTHGVKGALALGHNVDFDLRFLSQVMSAPSLKTALGYHKVCTLTLAVAVDQAHGATGAYSLVALAERYKVPLASAHDSMSDIEATVALYRLLVAQIREGSSGPTAVPRTFLVKNGADYVMAGGAHKGRILTDSKIPTGYLQWSLITPTLTTEERAAIAAALTLRTHQ